ncbi:PREDICTED: uncharacterized protein LOC109227894 [Nicotiana attenuata]|uniref:uncharacterized protein LOC109227894 n=1 Tax=Nicotiana attenuata TaxID=49451 RepID=UPI0009056B44|nr:PREDICTED: uncharacterized protein LOC109227894 [Nicotiana attenuata]
MARRNTNRKPNSQTTLTKESTEDNSNRMVTPESGVIQHLAPVQLVQWMPGMGSAPTIMQAPPPKEIETIKVTENNLNTAARKLTYSTRSGEEKRTMADVVKGNRTVQQGMQLKFYPPEVRDGIKIVKLNQQEMEQQCKKWETTLIGYVMGGNPTFKEMLKFAYGVWNSVTTPTVLLHDDGYFIFRFESIEDKLQIMEKGPYTFNNTPMILKNWEPEFDMDKEPMRAMPMWVTLPGLPIQCWAEENLGRIASCLGKPICTDKLTANCERVSYARVLIEMDITQPFPDDLHLELSDGKVRVQTTEYEWIPKFCQECNQFGHLMGNVN